MKAPLTWTARRWVIVGAAICAGVVLGYPRRIMIAPEWVIVVRDPDEKPVPGVLLTEVWGHYDVEGSHDDDRWTDECGTVVFPPRSARVPLLWQALSRLVGFGTLSPHASRGPHASVGIHCRAPETKFEHQGLDLPLGEHKALSVVTVKGGQSCKSARPSTRR